jgi:hypothetical protein
VTTARKYFLIGAAAAAIALLLAAGWFVFAIESPPNRASAIRATLEWGRLAPFPVLDSELHIKTSGSAFTRQFDISFTGDPEQIQQWIRSSPGTRGLVPLLKRDPDGWVVYQIEPEKALIVEVHVSPDGRQVRVRAVWS